MGTIFAQATPPGKSGVAVIRISGPRAIASAEVLAGPDLPMRAATLRKLRDADGGHLDTGLILVFPAGASFTGEEVVELQLHGSPAVVQGVLQALGSIEGLRLAEPGEFTRRALENDRLDLAQVEGLADLIEAETEAQRRQALRVLSGAVGDMAERWRRDLLQAIALIEATIDFADEEVPDDVVGEAVGILNALIPELAREVEGARISERIGGGFEVAILGAPNVGKSTLLNALAGREAAITSETAGTTRDVIEVRMDLGGLPVTLLDTAGIREAADGVERIGIDRALSRGQGADLRVFLLAPGEVAPVATPEPGDIVVRGKADLAAADGLAVSGKTGAGLDELVEMISAELGRRAATAATAIRARQRIAISDALAYIEAAVREAGAGPDRVEIAAEEIYRALHALDVLVGRVDVEQVLDVIFASFCMGK